MIQVQESHHAALHPKRASQSASAAVQYGRRNPLKSSVDLDLESQLVSVRSVDRHSCGPRVCPRLVSCRFCHNGEVRRVRRENMRCSRLLLRY